MVVVVVVGEERERRARGMMDCQIEGWAMRGRRLSSAAVC